MRDTGSSHCSHITQSSLALPKYRGVYLPTLPTYPSYLRYQLVSFGATQVPAQHVSILQRLILPDKSVPGTSI